MNKRYKILIVDDHEMFLRGFSAGHSRFFEVKTAQTWQEAYRLMLMERFDCAILDVNLHSDEATGIDLARWYRELDPMMAIVFITANDRFFFYQDASLVDVDDCLNKKIGIDALRLAILNAVRRRRRADFERRWRFGVFSSLLPHKPAVRLTYRDGDEGAEGMDGLLADKEAIRWVVYNIPEKPDRNIIAPASSVGCGRHCAFCEAGELQFKRNLTVPEIIAQVLHGFDSFHASRLFFTRRMVINFAGLGDPLFNLDNVCQAVKLLSGLQGIKFHFILTTIGQADLLEKFLAEYSDLPIEFYWSLNFLFERERYMRGTAGHDLLRLRDSFERIAQKTWRITTASYIVAKGINDRWEDAVALAEFLQAKPFEVKLMPLQEVRMKLREPTTEDDLDRFGGWLTGLGVPWRKRLIVGSGIRAGCGSTVPRTLLWVPL